MTEKYNGYMNRETWDFNNWVYNSQESYEMMLNKARTLNRNEFAGWLMYNARDFLGDYYEPENAHKIDFKELAEQYMQDVEDEENDAYERESLHYDACRDVARIAYDQRKIIDELITAY